MTEGADGGRRRTETTGAPNGNGAQGVAVKAATEAAVRIPIKPRCWKERVGTGQLKRKHRRLVKAVPAVATRNRQRNIHQRQRLGACVQGLQGGKERERVGPPINDGG